MEKYKISVIVPIYNVDKYLKKCIDSVIYQSYKNLEIILVDDGSPDKSGEICDKYALKDSRIKVIHKKNGGVSSARNVGIDAATGDYVCFLDGDDYVTNDYVDYLLKITENNDCEIGCSAEMFSPFSKKQFKNNRLKIVTGEKATEMILCYKLPIGANAKIFKLSFLKNNKIRFFEDLVIGEGFNFNTECFQLASKVAVGYKKIYFYRKDNPTSVTTLYNNKKWENGIYALEKIRSNFRINSTNIINAWNYAYWRTKTDAYDLLVIAKAEKKYFEMYNKCYKGIRKGFVLSLLCSVSTKDRLRAFAFMLYPKLIPYIMILRRKINKIKV